MKIKLLMAEFSLLCFFLLFLSMMNFAPVWFTDFQKTIINGLITFLVLALMTYMISKT